MLNKVFLFAFIFLLPPLFPTAVSAGTDADITGSCSGFPTQSCTVQFFADTSCGEYIAEMRGETTSAGNVTGFLALLSPNPYTQTNFSHGPGYNGNMVLPGGPGYTVGNVSITTYGIPADYHFWVTYAGCYAYSQAAYYSESSYYSQSTYGGPYSQSAYSGGNQATGNLDSNFGSSNNNGNCTNLFGWAWDPDFPNTPTTVHLYIDSLFAAIVNANQFRSDLQSAGYGNGNHGFTYTLPAGWKDGANHTINVYAIDLNGNGNPNLFSSPITAFNCSTYSYSQSSYYSQSAYYSQSSYAGAITALIRASDTNNLTVVPGNSVNYVWSSTGATSGSTFLQIINFNTGLPVSSDSCGNVSGPFPAFSGTSGSSSGSIVACQQGFIYQFIYTVNGPGVSAQDIVNVYVVSVPNPPIISGPSVGFPNTSYTFTVTGTDPIGSQVRYGIDWDMNDIADLWLPSGATYLNSGTPESTSRLWTTIGLKTFQALTQNFQGFNSAWTQKTINISNSPVDGICGSANKNYPSGSTSFGGDTFCSQGSLSSTPSFPSPGSPVSWQCLGQNGGDDSSCLASVSPLAVDYSITVNVNNTNTGTVVSTPSGINCGSTCYSVFTQDSNVVLRAVPRSLYWKFTGWSGDCTGNGLCSVVVDSPKVVNAVFSPNIFLYREF